MMPATRRLPALALPVLLAVLPACAREPDRTDDASGGATAEPGGAAGEDPGSAGPEQDGPEPGRADGGEGESAESGTAGPVEMRTGGAEAYQELLEKHDGKVVLVDFWATWCLPCVELFPHTVKLAREHADEGLVVIAVSLDDPEDEEKVRKFLEKNEAGGIEHLLSSEGPGQASFEAFDLRGGSIPQYKLYDDQGKLRHVFWNDPQDPSPFTKEDIARAVEEALASF